MNKFFANVITSFICDRSKRIRVRRRLTAQLTKYDRDHERYNIGEWTYLGSDTTIANEKDSIIGRYCSISHHVRIGLPQHPLNCLSTHTFYLKDRPSRLFGADIAEENKLSDFDRSQLLKPVEVGNDVWIGYGAIIMNGVKIGDGAVVAAGSIVTHDVPPYAIVGGVPAKLIKYRFDEKMREELLNLKWWDYDVRSFGKINWDDVPMAILQIKAQIAHITPYCQN